MRADNQQLRFDRIVQPHPDSGIVAETLMNLE